jgi:hypothetical protein
MSASGGPRRGSGEGLGRQSGMTSLNAALVRSRTRRGEDSSTDVDCNASSDGGGTVHFVGGASYPRFSRIAEDVDRAVARSRTGPIKRAATSRQTPDRLVAIFEGFADIRFVSAAEDCTRFGPNGNVSLDTGSLDKPATTSHASA